MTGPELNSGLLSARYLLGYHQLCHSPIIDASVIDSDDNWLCYECELASLPKVQLWVCIFISATHVDCYNNSFFL